MIIMDRLFRNKVSRGRKACAPTIAVRAHAMRPYHVIIRREPFTGCSGAGLVQFGEAPALRLVEVA